MPFRPKTAEEIERMRVAGRLAAQVLEMIAPHVQPGVSTQKLNDLCHDYMVDELGCIAAPLNYTNSPRQPPYPGSICTSVNHVVCHGIPSPKKVLRDGDIVNLDITVIKDGYHGDTSQTFFVGEPPVLARRLVDVTRACLYKGIAAVRNGARLGDIGAAIQAYADSQRFTVVQEYCGHGIGRGFHEEPQVMHYRTADPGPVMVTGMTFTIEPMINAGSRHVKLLPDHWTVVTKDHKLSAQFEHTILVTDDGCEVLTLRADETLPS